MSGGYFNYKQYEINEIANLERLSAELKELENGE
jgi:hypothetical protein